jgi:hypothetical protein
MRSRFTLILIAPARANFDSLPEPDKDAREVSPRNDADAPKAEAPRLFLPKARRVAGRAEHRPHTLPSLKLSIRQGLEAAGQHQPAGEPTPAPAAAPEASSRAAPRPARGQRHRP